MVSKALIRKSLLMRMWEKYPKVWKFLIDTGIFLKYKTLNIHKLPNFIKLPSSNILYINPSENRGRALLIKEGVTQERLTEFWRKAVELYEPSLVIDVGVNYGECLFSANYHFETKVYGIEANQYLLEYIVKSREEHPNKSQIHIVHAFASDQEKEDQLFYIDTHWSGTSSASYMPSHNMIEESIVPTITIDSLFEKESLQSHHLLFKVDVEGFEAFVLKGMETLFQNCRTGVGFIEYDSRYIENSGVEIDEFLTFLQRYFIIYVYDLNDRLIKMPIVSYGNLKELFKSDYVHTDFLLMSDESMERQLNLEVY
ncbi:FkbM family methyltransferase [Bacillus songklensis]